jgi:hypothetical protein
LQTTLQGDFLVRLKEFEPPAPGVGELRHSAQVDDMLHFFVGSALLCNACHEQYKTMCQRQKLTTGSKNHCRWSASGQSIAKNRKLQSTCIRKE